MHRVLLIVSGNDDLPSDWRPEEFKGQTIDLGVSAAREYASKEVKRIVEDNHLDMLEHDGYLVAESCTRADHPHEPPDGKLPITLDAGFNFALGSNSTDVSYHAVRAYYSIYEKVSIPDSYLKYATMGVVWSTLAQRPMVIISRPQILMIRC